jgi:ubiquinone/menaquinone biosynthesis C-methylase UbiE
MKNYERYKSVNTADYDKKTFMSLLCRIPSDRKIIPYIAGLKGKKILDVGLGTGYYTKILVEKNKVVGIDQNIHLCRLSIPLYKGDATQLSKIVGDEKFDIVFSTWMTEYLNPEQLSAFLGEAKKVLNEQGIFVSTFISNYCFGYAYVKLAKILKNIDKFCYSKKQILELISQAGFKDIEIINISSWLNIPWAYVATAGKTG